MTQDGQALDPDVQALVQAVHQELRTDFVQSIPGRVAALKRLAQAVLDSPPDPQTLHGLHAEAHRFAGTAALYGMLRTSAVVKRFDQLLLERMRAGVLTLCPKLLQAFLDELNAAIAAET
jgi:chemotaxis protein histidine kinase CheA